MKKETSPVVCDLFTWRKPLEPLNKRGCIQKFPDWINNEIYAYLWYYSFLAAKLTRLTHRIEIQLHLVAESYIIRSSRSRRPVRKLLDTPSYTASLFLIWNSTSLYIKHYLVLSETYYLQFYLQTFGGMWIWDQSANLPTSSSYPPPPIDCSSLCGQGSRRNAMFRIQNASDTKDIRR
jgi:hypothetical protein